MGVLSNSSRLLVNTFIQWSSLVAFLTYLTIKRLFYFLFILCFYYSRRICYRGFAMMCAACKPSVFYWWRMGWVLVMNAGLQDRWWTSWCWWLSSTKKQCGFFFPFSVFLMCVSAINHQLRRRPNVIDDRVLKIWCNSVRRLVIRVFIGWEVDLARIYLTWQRSNAIFPFQFFLFLFGLARQYFLSCQITVREGIFYRIVAEICLRNVDCEICNSPILVWWTATFSFFGRPGKVVSTSCLVVVVVARS
jgi:hypothetical protein